MKKFALLIAVLFVLSCGTGAWAALTTMTFDEAFVTGGTTADRQDGTQVSNQYAGSPYGVTWADIYSATDHPSYTGQVVCLPGEFNGTGWRNDNSLWIYGNTLSGSGTPQTATVTLSTPSDYFSMDYRRPQASGTIEFFLYSQGTQVADSGVLTWNPGDNWKTWSTSSVTFDKVVILEGDKFSVDNFSIEPVNAPVPEPGLLFLLAPGLAGLALARRRIKK